MPPRMYFLRANTGVSLAETTVAKLFVFGAAGIGLACFSAPGVAQETDGGALMRQQDSKDPTPAPPSFRLEVQPPDQDTKARPVGTEESTVFVRGYRLLAESKILPQNKLDDLLRDLSERPVSFGEIQQAAEAVGKYFQSKGYIFASAYIPRQEIENGIVVLDILVGKRASSIQANADIVLKLDTALRSHLDPEFAKSVIGSDMPPGEPVKLEQVERGLLLLNDLPGIKASGVVVPGSEPGTIGLVVQAEEEGPVKAGVSVDNQGSQASGEVRVGANLAINGMSGRGDALTLRLSKSIGTRQGIVSYSFPISPSGLKLQLIGSRLDYEQGQEFSNLDLNGQSTWGAVGISYPLILTRRHSLNATVQVNEKRIVDRARSTEISSRKNFNVVTGLQGSRMLESKAAIHTYGISLTAGTLDRANVPADLQQDAATRRTAGHYTIIRLDTSYALGLSPTIVFQTNFEGQFATKNLDSSERFYVGGPRGVRAYPVDEAGGDSGALVRFEARWRPWRLDGSQDFSLIGFFDWASLRRNRVLWDGWNAGNPGMLNIYSLMGTGLGISYAQQGIGRIEFLYARKIGSRKYNGTASVAEGSGNSRFWVNGALSF